MRMALLRSMLLVSLRHMITSLSSIRSARLFTDPVKLSVLIEYLDQNGKFLDQWTQFSNPSGIFIDSKDVMYVADDTEEL